MRGFFRLQRLGIKRAAYWISSKHQRTCFSGIFPVVATVIASSALLIVPIAPKSSFELRTLFFGKVSMAFLQVKKLVIRIPVLLWSMLTNSQKWIALSSKQFENKRVLRNEIESLRLCHLP